MNNTYIIFAIEKKNILEVSNFSKGLSSNIGFISYLNLVLLNGILMIM
ncbi:hypothetical protein FHU23_002634 [Clostridium saccharobutylicum]|nr:hypothetical protein [Clostridium saccharobutylicum]MBA8897247.1 hypothetical protein [Clostridium saccharobutylicum]MBA8982955.1 hypothetical protein [Clostridium saccharobutylicum]MBA8998455.1 hypothetical protein [Clostridium saccharobutylicum]MBA9009902.1 hypothetical protein [Clostridium saccharobutylicum]